MSAHRVAERLLKAEPGTASEHGLDGGRGHLPVADPGGIEASARLHEVSLDPVFGTNLWVEVLTDRVSEGRAARLSPAALPAADCGVAFASFKGHQSPLRHRMAVASCLSGGHAIWWLVNAPSPGRALELLPFYVTQRSTAVEVREIQIP